MICELSDCIFLKIKCDQMCVGEIVLQNLVERVTFFCHLGSTNLAQSNAVTPSGTMQGECGRDGFVFAFLDGEVCGIETRVRECLAYFKFLPDVQLAFGADYAQKDYSASGPSRDGNKVDYVAKVNVVTTFE